MNTDSLLTWLPEESKLVSVPPNDNGRLLAADSWLVSEGFVRGLDLHRERFLVACAEAADFDPVDVKAFWRHMIQASPRDGIWFPRVELVDDEGATKLQFRLRKAPPITESVRLTIWDEADPRVHPRRKGPDLARLASMRQQVIARGADEALLTSSEGFVLEGLTASVFWWEGDTLCFPDSDLPVLASVTGNLLVQLAEAAKIRVVKKRSRINDLQGRAVWTANALHGIRPVSHWVLEQPSQAAFVDPAPFQKKLLKLRAHLDELLA